MKMSKKYFKYIPIFLSLCLLTSCTNSKTQPNTNEFKHHDETQVNATSTPKQIEERELDPILSDWCGVYKDDSNHELIIYAHDGQNGFVTYKNGDQVESSIAYMYEDDGFIDGIDFKKVEHGIDLEDYFQQESIFLEKTNEDPYVLLESMKYNDLPYDGIYERYIYDDAHISNESLIVRTYKDALTVEETNARGSLIYEVYDNEYQLVTQNEGLKISFNENEILQDDDSIFANIVFVSKSLNDSFDTPFMVLKQFVFVDQIIQPRYVLYSYLGEEGSDSCIDLYGVINDYYMRNYEVEPPCIDIVLLEDGNYQVHVYEELEDHITTWAWYIIDPYTLCGYDDVTFEEIDFMND